MATTSQSIPTLLPAPLKEALRLLGASHNQGVDARTNPERQGVSVARLRAAGTTDLELSQLVALGFASLIRQGNLLPRGAVLPGSLSFPADAAVVLTEAGAAWFRQVILTSTMPLPLHSVCPADPTQRGERDRVPHWDKDLRELRHAGLLAKDYRQPARCQELILDVFEEEGWGAEILDPLSGGPDVDPRERLHDTVKNLNRHQKQARIHFRVTGMGTKVRWEIPTGPWGQLP
jgi:hypothetical protein